MDQKRSLDYPAQLGLLLVLTGVCFVAAAVFYYIAMMMLHIKIEDLSNPAHATEAKWLNTIGSFISFFLPVFILYRIAGKKPLQQIGFRSALSLRQVATVALITLASMIFSGALGELNQKIPLTKELLKEARDLEEKYRNAMIAMAQMKNAGDYLIALLVMALAPAITEETMFRGGFQQILVGWTKNKWAGIIITSILFSAIHFSFFGFLPRLALGIVLGLIFYYSKNIWLNIFLHFLNNALVVTELFVLSLKGKSIDKTMDESLPVWWGILGLGALVALIPLFRNESRKILQRAQVHSSPENIPS